MEKGTKHILLPNGDDGHIPWLKVKHHRKKKKKITPKTSNWGDTTGMPKMGNLCNLMTLVKTPSNHYGWSSYTPLTNPPQEIRV